MTPKTSGNSYELGQIVSHSKGKGQPPVLLLHGWGSDPQALSVIAQPLSAHRRVISLALPGFGGSPEPPESWGTWDYVEMLIQWMDSQDLKRVDIIAHSFGGRVTIGLASRYPERVNRIVLMGSAGLVLPRSLRTRTRIVLARALRNAGKVGGAGVEKWMEAKRQRMGSVDWQAASAVMRQTLSRVINEDFSTELTQINSPSLLIWGENDAAVPPAIGRKMADLIPDSEFLLLKNAGHYCFLDRKGETVSAIWRHLELPKVW